MEEKEEKYNPVRDYLANGLEDKEVHLWDEEIEKIIVLANRMQQYRANKGIRHQRTQTNEREKAFSDQWMKENIPDPGLNHGNGILQDLFCTRNTSPLQISIPIMEERINIRDRMIVATIIQWLGSNVGMNFLNDALKRFNARIVTDYGTEKQREY